MKVSPLVTKNPYNVLPVEETQNDGLPSINPIRVSYYVINFLSKLRIQLCQTQNTKNISLGESRKKSKRFIHSIHPKPEIQMKIGLKTVDTHKMVEVDALLDSGATGLFIDRALVKGNQITTCKLQHPIPVYNIDGSINRGGSITEEVTLIMSYQGHRE
jgi:hypothetical protein